MQSPKRNWTIEQEKGVRDRLAMMMDRRGFTAASLAREAGLERVYVDDFMSGRKKSMRAAAMVALAKKLMVDPTWLYHGGPEATPALPVEKPLLLPPPIQKQSQKIVKVHPASDAILAFDRVDRGGECVIMSEDGSRHVARIVDPALAVAGDVYTSAFASGKPAACRVKVVVMDDGTRSLVILDAEPMR